MENNNQCCKLCKPNTLEKRLGLDTCRNYICSCHIANSATTCTCQYEKGNGHSVSCPLYVATPAPSHTEEKCYYCLDKTQKCPILARTEGEEWEERFDENFIERHIWNENPILYDTSFEEINTLKDFIRQEKEKSRIETEKLINEKLIPFQKELRTETRHETIQECKKVIADTYEKISVRSKSLGNFTLIVDLLAALRKLDEK